MECNHHQKKFGDVAILPIEPQASEVMQIENDLVILSLDDRYHVSFHLTTQKEEDNDDSKEVPPKKEEDDDMMEIDDVMKTRPLEGMARYALTVLISCDGECFQSSPAQLITDSLRFVCMFQLTTKCDLVFIIYKSKVLSYPFILGITFCVPKC